MSNPHDPTPEGLPPLPPPPPPADDDDIPMALSDLDEAAEDVPAAEPADGLVGFDLPDLPDVPAGERTMGVEFAHLPEFADGGLPPIPPVSASESWVTDEDAAAAVRYDPPADIPAAEPVSDVIAAEAVPDAEPVSGVSASSLFGESVPAAEPVSGVSDVPLAAAAEDSGVNVGAAPPVNPVSPASGWYSQSDLAAMADDPAADPIEAELGAPPPALPYGESSDIFAAAPPAREIDQSDVIAATAWRDADPFEPSRPKTGGRTSDVALTFDQPPGGSTIQEDAGDDLPVADEVPEAEPVGDSATLAHAPPLPDEAPDFGGSARGGADASSILAELSGPDEPVADGSAIRWENPGVGATLNDEPLADDPVLDATTTDGEPAFPSDWADEEADVDLGGVQSGSDLFAANRPAGPHFELTPDTAGMVDPFEGVDESEEPSLGSASASIFTAPAGPLSSGSNLPTGEADAVEFSDHPDPAAAGVDFNLADDATYPDRTIRAEIPDEDVLGGTDAEAPALPGSSTGDVLGAAGIADAADWLTDPTDVFGAPQAVPAPASGVLSRSKLPKPQQVDLSDPTDPGLHPDAGFAPEPARPTRPAAPRPAAALAGSGSVELDWVDESTSGEKPVPAAVRTGRPGRLTPRPADDDDDTTGTTAAVPALAGGRTSRGAGLGLLFGLLIGAGAASGVYFSGVLDRGTPKGPVALNPTPNNGGSATQQPAQPAAPQLTVADAAAALDAGDPARALKAIEAAGATTPEAKAARGQARLLARLREGAPPAADDAALKDARADLEAVVNDADAARTPAGEKAAVRAAVHLGLTLELAGDRAKAREVYSSAAAKFPKAADVFQAALDRLDAIAPAAAGATSLRLAPADAERLLAAAAFLFVQDEPAPAAGAELPEAGGLFWRAVNLAAAGKFADAAAAIDRAKAAHQARARALAGRGLNPLTDPLEQVFPRACDDLKAYWQLRRTLYEHPGVGAVVRAEGVGKALDAFAADRTAKGKVEAALKLSDQKLAAAQKGLLAEQEALKTAKAELKVEAAKADVLGKDLLKAKTEVGVLMKEVEATKKLANDFFEKAKTLDTELAKAEKGRKDAEATLAGVAGELGKAKLLPEKHTPADLVAAAKTAASRATGPDLTSLVPPGTAGAIGGPATTAAIVDFAARTSKAEAAAKQAGADLTAATAKFKADTAKAKAEYDAGLKAAADAHAAALKKAADEAEKTLTKTKTDAAGELAKTKADAAGELAKAKTDYAATLKKLTDEHKAEVAKLEKGAADAAAAAKSALARAEEQHRAQLANTVQPAEALPLWLPMLTELHRRTDADPALAAAARVLKTAPPGSEDAARAHTVAGLALALKGDAEGARDRFELARRSPAYAPTKVWARAADVGLASLADPAAGSRRPVPPPPGKDAVAAARTLGAGVAAYNAGRLADAERLLAEAIRLDPADETSPVPWYFLGAARWAAGNVDQARADFRQGALRELRSAEPARAVSNRLSPIQGPARTALEQARLEADRAQAAEPAKE